MQGTIMSKASAIMRSTVSILDADVWLMEEK